MTSVLHIFDAHAQDQVIENEDEYTKEISLVENDSEDDDEEFSSRKRFKKVGYRSFRERQSMMIYLFGCTALGQPVRLEVSGFKPFFYLRLPEIKKQSVERTFADCRDRLHAEFQAILEASEGQKDLIPESCVEFSLVYKKILYGYTGGKEFPFMELKFKSLAVFRAVRNLVLDECMKPKFQIYAGGPVAEVYDANLDPLLRFFHLRNISPCGWIRVDTKLIALKGSMKDSNTVLEGECDWTAISPESTPPRACAPFKMAAWDIECYSESGEFPLARKADKKDGTAGDPVIQIGTVIVQQDKPTERHVFVVDSCDSLDADGIKVHKFKTEKAMLLAWASWLELQNPDILVGYNTFGFDEKYVWHRATELGIEKGNSPFQAMTRLSSIGKEVKLDEKFLSSSALGDNYLYIWSTHGRLQIDLYHYVRRTASLPSYKLDEVAKYYMSGKCKQVLNEGTHLKIKTKVTSDLKCGRYVCLLDETGEEIFEKAPVLATLEDGFTIAMPSNYDEDTDLSEIEKWAIVKDDVPPQEIFRLHREGGPEGRAKVAKYCVQDCDLVVELYKKLDVFNNAMSMANVCSVPVSYIFTRGQGVKIESLIFKDCFERNMLVVTKDAPARSASAPTQQESYEGAIVLDPNPGFYMDSPIGVCDFASLYPSSIISENISYDSLVWVKDYTLDGKLVLKEDGSLPHGSEADEKYAPPGTQWTDISFDIWGVKEGDTRKNPEKVRKGVRVCRYAQPADGTKHTLPDIVAKLLAARKAKRKEAEKENDPFRKALLDAEQLAYKLTANSLYGQLGSATFKIRLQNLAASVTAYGRKQIMFAKEAIEEFYGPAAKDPRCSAEIVYGDTDSLFVKFNVKNPETGELLKDREAIVKTIEITEEAGHLVTQALKYPHDFEYDKVFYPFIIFSKKRYVGNKYEESPDEFKQTSMGIVLKRRDNAPVLKTIYGGAIKLLLNEHNAKKAAEFVMDKCLEMVQGKMSMHQLTITKSLSAKYKPDWIKGDILDLEAQIAKLEKSMNGVTEARRSKIEENIKIVRGKLDDKRSEFERHPYPAHKILADRIAERDPGNAPASGERIGFVYVSPSAGQVAPKLQGDRIETPSFIKDKGIKPDFRYYIEHQLMNPLGQLFQFIVDEIPGFTGTKVADSQRESLAVELLFNAAFQECDKNAIREFATQKLGANIVVNNSQSSVRRSTRTSSQVGESPSGKQSLITGFLKPLDPGASFMITKALVDTEKTVKKNEEKKADDETKAKGKRKAKTVSVNA